MAAAGLPVLKRAGAGYMTQCPAHEDDKASLWVGYGERAVIMKCHAGCAFRAIIAALGDRINIDDLFTDDGKTRATVRAARVIRATYDYCRRDGRLIYQVVRYEPKTFCQRRPGADGEWTYDMKNIKRSIYRLPELTALPAGSLVLVVEGEEDVHAAERLGYAATCNSGGAGKWPEEAGPVFRGMHVVLIPDVDKPGRVHMRDVARNVLPHAATVRWLDLPQSVPAHGDLREYAKTFDTCHAQRQALDDLIERAPEATTGRSRYEKERRAYAHRAAELFADALGDPDALLPADYILALADEAREYTDWLTDEEYDRRNAD